MCECCTVQHFRAVVVLVLVLVLVLVVLVVAGLVVLDNGGI